MIKLIQKIPLLFAVLSVLLFTACTEVKDAGRTIGHTTRNVTTEIGHGTRDVVKDIGHGSRRAVRAVGEGAKETVKSLSDDDQ